MEEQRNFSRDDSRDGSEAGAAIAPLSFRAAAHAPDLSMSEPQRRPICHETERGQVLPFALSFRAAGEESHPVEGMRFLLRCAHSG